MVLFGIFKRKKKGNQTPNNEHVPAINSTVTSHSEAGHLTEPKYTSITAKKATAHAANTNITATNLTSGYSQQPQKAVRDKQKPLRENDPNQWLFETFLEYLSSPLWKIPINSFIDENCIVFDNEEENKIEYTEIHKKFKKMIEDMLSNLLAELEVTEEQFLQVVNKGLSIKQYKKIFEQLLIADNFLVFKKLMIKRNKELELEALRQFEEQGSQHHHTHRHSKHESSRSTEIERLNLQKEQAEIEEAIARSLAIEQEKLKLQELEDKELQQALRESQREFEVMQELENRRLQEEEKKKYLQRLNEAYLKEKAKENSKMETQKPMEEALKQPSTTEDKKSVEIIFNNAENEQKGEELRFEELPSLGERKRSVKLEPIEGGPEEVKEKLQEAAQPKWRGTLPPIGRRNYDAFSNEELMKQKEQIAKKLDGLEANQKLEVTQESLEERKKRLQAQRELILKKKREEREAELKCYEQQKKSGEPPSTEPTEDLPMLGGMPSVDAKEIEKRRAIYQKLKLQLQTDTAPFKMD